MKRKSIIFFLVISMMATILVGCGGEEKPETPVEKEETSLEEKETEKTKVEALDKNKVYVGPEWIKSVIDGEQKESEDFVLLEVSWGTEKDSPDYLEGHIPGAIHVDTGSIEDEPLWNLRDPKEIEESLLDLGITKDTTTIMYSKDPSGVARVAFAYLWAGVENVKILDGTIDTWKEAGFEVEKDSNTGARVEEFGVEIPAHPEYVLSLEETKEKLANDDNFKLVSIRSYEEHIGETSGYSYIPKAGEPKGAVWGKGGSSAFTMEDYVKEDGRVLTMDEMKELWSDLEFDDSNELSFYCGTGWRAAIPFLIMYENGYTNMNMFDGGWFEWQMHDELEVQVGDPTKDDLVYTTVGELSDDKAAVY